MQNIPTKVLFIHHSTGANLLKEGGVRELLAGVTPNTQLWDHGYNLLKFPLSLLGGVDYRTGLSDQFGRMTGKDYDIVISNNSPKEYAEIFSRSPQDPTLSKILSYDIVIFKSCYPTSRITNDKQLEEYEHLYTDLKENLQKYTHKTFIAFTQPPLRQELTTQLQANRARKLADWIASELPKDVSNIQVFDFFDLLANESSMLRREYCKLIPLDGHPNAKANRNIAPLLVDFIVQFSKKGL